MEDVELARSGEPSPGWGDSRPARRIPAMTVTVSGRIIVAWDVRRDWRDLPGEIDIVLRHSADHGRTWSEPAVLRAHTPGHGYGDASLLTDPATGTVFCFHVGSTGASFFSAEAAPSDFALEEWLSVSTDDGDTWRHRRLDDLRPDGVAGMFATSGNGAVTATGRLLQPHVLRIDGEHHAGIARSDDHGETWTMSAPIGPDCDENKVLALADGRILLHARATPRRRWAISTDDGTSFGEPQPHPHLTEPACNGGLARLGDVVVCSILDDPEERRRLCLHVSHDDGATWSAPVLVDPGACGYSVLVPLADGALGLLWEQGDYEAIRFARISPAEIGLEGNPPLLVPRAGTGDAAKPPEVAG